MLLLEANAAAAHSVILALVRRGALEGQLGVKVQARSCRMSRSACVCVRVCVWVFFALELREAPANSVGRASPRATRIALTSASEPSSWSTLERMEDCVCGHHTTHARPRRERTSEGEEAPTARASPCVRPSAAELRAGMRTEHNPGECARYSRGNRGSRGGGGWRLPSLLFLESAAAGQCARP